MSDDSGKFVLGPNVKSLTIRLPKGMELPVKIEFYERETPDVEGQSVANDCGWTVDKEGNCLWNCACGANGSCGCLC